MYQKDKSNNKQRVMTTVSWLELESIIINKCVKLYIQQRYSVRKNIRFMGELTFAEKSCGTD